ncbi:uncharacterized protein EV420DRAFT_1273616 [Desarmillaria tabescens]|uniref:Uncharacterized protein n=1 Tax=Armillaria tabescens TaxID=1929756 RepID=A0AA39K1L7_ARMTA|nr:uncharacterized protein EV420DRAFT_1273616 [Desarmillaria tabescens]KAK0452723.1 hypothetical protein EV420DRAFT_1273616 [Desarmillaria tabescens]
MKSCAKQQAAAEKATAECNGEPPLQQSSLVPFVQGSTYTSGQLRLYEVEWAAKCHCPYRMFKDPPYWNIIHMFNPNIKMLSADTVTHDVKEVYQITKKQVVALLRIHVAQDGWAVPQKLSLMGLVAIWVADGKLQTLMLDMVQ